MVTLHFYERLRGVLEVDLLLRVHELGAPDQVEFPPALLRPKHDVLPRVPQVRVREVLL